MLIILAMDSEAILPAVKKATDEGIPVIAYDRLIESPNVLYITFDNVGVGRMMAKAIDGRQARRQLRLHQGRQGRSERRLPVLGHQGSARAGDGGGQDQERRRILHRRLEAGQRAEEHGADPHQEQQQGRRGRRARTTAWPAASSRRSRAQGMAGSVPVSGQDGDHAAINRIALGTQTVSIWKDARDLGKTAGEAAVDARRRQEDDRHSRREAVHRRRQGHQGQWHPADPARRSPGTTST